MIDAIPSNKAPRMDGFNSHFVKKVWEVVKDDLFLAITDFLEVA